MDTSATKPSMLLRLRDEHDDEVWSQFVSIYAPLVYEFLQKRGLQDSDAADLTQDVLASVVGAIKTFDYDPERGSFRRWLLTIVQNRLNSFWRTRHRRVVGSGDSQVAEILKEHPQPQGTDSADWDGEYEKRLFQYAADRVCGAFQESTWRAFWETAVEGHPIGEVARRLGMTPSAIYMARRRVIARIKEQVRFVEGELP